MMRRWVLAVLMTMGTALWAMASEPPNAEPVSLSTYVDLPVEFDIGQYVTDDDPLEKLSFEVISPPRNGAIVGIPPVFVYIPDPGFAGRDFALILVTDPWGEFDLAVVEVYVASREIFVSPPAFRVNQRLTLEAPPPSLTLNFTGIGASQRIGDFVLDLDAGFTSLGFVSFRTKLRGIVELPGARLKLTSSTNFDPALPGLKTWRNELRFSAVGLTFRGIAFFDFATPGNSYNRLRIEGKLEGLEAKIRGEIDFSQWPLEYEDLWFELSMGFPCCEGPELKTRFSASKENGFEEFKISLTGLKFGCCDPLDPEIGLITTFTVDSKEVEAIFELSPVWFLCARPYIDIDLLDTGVGIEGFDFFGYEIRCDLPGDNVPEDRHLVEPCQERTGHGIKRILPGDLPTGDRASLLRWAGALDDLGLLRCRLRSALRLGPHRDHLREPHLGGDNHQGPPHPGAERVYPLRIMEGDLLRVSG